MCNKKIAIIDESREDLNMLLTNKALKRHRTHNYSQMFFAYVQLFSVKLGWAHQILFILRRPFGKLFPLRHSSFIFKPARQLTASVFICFCLLSFFLSIYLCLSFTAVSPLDLLLIFIADRPHASSDTKKKSRAIPNRDIIKIFLYRTPRTNSLCFGKADESMALENRKRFVVHISYEQWSLTLFLCSVYV